MLRRGFKKITPFLILSILGLAGVVLEMFTGHWGSDGWTALAIIPLTTVFVAMLLIDIFLKIVRGSTTVIWTVEIVLLLGLVYYWIIR